MMQWIQWVALYDSMMFLEGSLDSACVSTAKVALGDLSEL